MMGRRRTTLLDAAKVQVPHPYLVRICSRSAVRFGAMDANESKITESETEKGEIIYKLIEELLQSKSDPNFVGMVHLALSTRTVQQQINKYNFPQQWVQSLSKKITGMIVEGSKKGGVNLDKFIDEEKYRQNTVTRALQDLIDYDTPYTGEMMRGLYGNWASGKKYTNWQFIDHTRDNLKKWVGTISNSNILDDMSWGNASDMFDDISMPTLDKCWDGINQVFGFAKDMSDDHRQNHLVQIMNVLTASDKEKRFASIPDSSIQFDQSDQDLVLKGLGRTDMQSLLNTVARLVLLWAYDWGREDYLWRESENRALLNSIKSAQREIIRHWVDARPRHEGLEKFQFDKENIIKSRMAYERGSTFRVPRKVKKQGNRAVTAFLDAVIKFEPENADSKEATMARLRELKQELDALRAAHKRYTKWGLLYV